MLEPVPYAHMQCNAIIEVNKTISLAGVSYTIQTANHLQHPFHPFPASAAAMP